MKTTIKSLTAIFLLTVIFSCIPEEEFLPNISVTFKYNCSGNCTVDITYYGIAGGKTTEMYSTSTSSTGFAVGAKQTIQYKKGEVAKIKLITNSGNATIEIPEGTVVKSGTGAGINLSYTVK